MKFNVTAELALLLKTLQNQGNISAKDLAAHISKSPSYISKLENGDVKSIHKDTLTQILLYLTNGSDFFADTLPVIVRTLQSFMPPERLAEQIWLLQYDIVERPVQISHKLIHDIKEKMISFHISSEDIANAINAESEPRTSFSSPVDEIVGYQYNDTSILRVKITITPAEIDEILSGRKNSTNYMTIFSIFFQLSKYEKHQNFIHMEPESAKIVLRDTRIYLEYYDIHSLTGYGHLISSEEFLNRQEALLNSFDSVNGAILDDIITSFHAASKHDALKTTQLLDNLRHNLQWDLAFTMKILGISYSSLSDMSYCYKKQLLDDIAELIQQYADIPDCEKKIETY